MMRKPSGTVIVAIMIATLAGCSGGDGLPREPVSGLVAVESKPLAKGLITFLPADAELSTQGGSAIVDGKYSIPKEEGLVPGQYRVVISSAGAESEKAKDMANGMPGMAAPLPKEALPSEYNTKSTLTREVKAGDSNHFEFDLKSAPLKK
jgi:hypothetical protein